VTGSQDRRPAGEHGGSDAGGSRAGAQVAPYGSWRSPIDVDLVAGAVVGISEPWPDGDDVYWLETRAAQRGRRTLLRLSPDGTTRELTPDPFNVRSRVHEYGGGSFAVDAGRVVASAGPDDRVWLLDPGGLAAPVALTPPGPWRYADLWFDPRAPRLYAVRETHDAAQPNRPDLVRNELVVLALDGSDGPGRVLASASDFVAGARPSPDGSRLAWLEWDLPDMPWDSVGLRLADVSADGSLGEARTVAGGAGISIVQASWDPRGVLHFVSDETGWWNLYAFDGPDGTDGPARNLAPMEAELGDPAWVFGRSSYAFLAGGAILAVARADGRDAFVRIAADGSVARPESPFTEVEGLRAAGTTAIAVAAGPHEGSLLLRLDPETAQPVGVLARSLSTPLEPGVLPRAEPIAFPTADGARARALYFAPSNEAFRGPTGELPPLIVIAHGGPTGAASSALSLERAFFTSRGIAVVDVDYRGSSGYGRPYRDALKGQWGIADVEDCVSAARFLVERGSVDPARMTIRGGSAGGFTALAALAFRPDAFAAGISYYGIADLELIHVDGHKFESRYDEGLLAPWTPEGRAVFRERSPIHFLDRVRAPVLLFQGLDDRVVPPSQLDAMVAAFRAQRVPHVARTFEGEGHGFRRADTKRVVFRTELAFLGRVFGFEPDDDLPELEIPGLAARPATPAD
jgi:dipeptidyl aminopeptidase/acylaminoacyl peptidase